MPNTIEPLLVNTSINTARLQSWFTSHQDVPYVTVRLSAEHAEQLQTMLGIAVRRCYITDDLLVQRATVLGLSRSDVLATKLPDAGSTMSGDFGEVLAYLYHVAHQYPRQLLGPKKWRLKQDRTKPAPHSDVIHFFLPSWPNASEDDELLCSEVKTKATDGDSKPISTAIVDSQKDCTSRLAKTLVWLRERAIGEDLGDISLDQLNRFINATDHPSHKKEFYAVVAICGDLVANELLADPPVVPPGHNLLLIVIPKLKEVYSAVFESARASVDLDDDEDI